MSIRQRGKVIKRVQTIYYKIYRSKSGKWMYERINTNRVLRDNEICYHCETVSDIKDYIREAELSKADIDGYIFEVKKVTKRFKSPVSGSDIVIDGGLLSKQIHAMLESNMPEAEKTGLHHLLGALMDCYVDDIKDARIAFKSS